MIPMKDAFFCSGEFTKPVTNVHIIQTDRSHWELFKKYHYMNTSLNRSSVFYLALIDDKPAACFAVLHFPHPSTKKFKRGHRLVVLPDYQGIGLGHLLSSTVAKHYVDQGDRFIITSNTRSLYKQRERDPNWLITRIGRTHTYFSTNKGMKRSGSQNKITISYEYIGSTSKNMGCIT